MKKILISVIIPTYKRNDYVERAIYSVINSSNKLEECEIIVVDDNGIDTEYQKDNELKLNKFKEYKNFHYIKHKKNLNGATARNTGIRNSQGKYITFLDDDDEFINERIKEIKNIINKDDYDFIFSNVIHRKKNKKDIYFKPNVDINNINDLVFKLLCQYSFIGTGSNLICKKEIIDKINGFDESFVRNQDIEFLIRYLGECKKIAYLDKYLVIKNTEDYMNVPNVDKYLDIKEKLLKKYKKIINQYSDNDIKEIYASNYYELLKIAIINDDKKNIKEIISILRKYNVNDFFKTFKYLIKYNLIKFKNFVGRIIERR